MNEKMLFEIDDVLRTRLAKLLIRLRRHYGDMLPQEWLERPMSFYRWALELIAEINAPEDRLSMR